MCYNGCDYWQTYAETCKKPKGVTCPMECDDEEDAISEEDIFLDRVDTLYATHKDECHAATENY